MKRLINRSEDFVKETMGGITYVHGDKVRLLDGDGRILLTSYPVEQGKVGIVTTGGSGHLPIFLGYVGQEILDGCAVDNAFAFSSTKKMADMIKTCDHGSGVLCLYGNYGGDNMSFDMACETVEVDDIEAKTVRVKDDAASGPEGTKEERRGAAGTVHGLEAAGAAVERMMSLDGMAAVAEETLDNTQTTGVALSPYIAPRVGKPIFKIGDNETETGMGIHGEKGTEMGKMMIADEVVKTLVDRITQDTPLTQRGKVPVLVNGLEATSMEEQLIMYRCAHELLAEKGVRIIMPHIGEYAISMEMADLSAIIFRLDGQLKEPLITLTKALFYTNLNK